MSKWFLEAMQNAVLAGHLSVRGALNVMEALGREEDGGKPMRKDELPKYEDELENAIETFEDENDRKPTEDELTALKAECREKVDSAEEAYSEYVASGAFECEECGKTHYHHAPPACCRSHNYDRDRDRD